MSLLLKALKRLETPPIAAPASPSSDESNAAIEPISTGGELVPDDASQPLSESLSVEADPTLWDAELPTTDNEPLPAEPVESLPDVILWSEEITALSTDKALFPAEIDALREPAHLDPAPTGDAIPEVEIAAPTINSTTDDQTEDDSPATILFAAPSDERATVIQAVVVLSVIEPPSFGDSVEQTPEAVVANPPLTIYAGDDAPPAALEAPDASSTFQSLRGAVPATTDEEPIVEELTPPVVIEDCTIDFATQSAATVETLPEHALRIAPVDPGDESEDLQLDHAALGMRLSQLRMHGLCENIASQITEADHPVVLLVPVLPLLGMESLVADLAKQFAARLG